MIKDNYTAFDAHKIGTSHISKGLQCEDFSDSYIDENIAVAVVSDGHGDKNCFRSAKGAELACLVAIETTKDLFNTGDSVREVAASPDRLICELEKSIIYNWTLSVEKDIRENPINDEELSGLNEDVVTVIKSGNRLVKIYGCTLIMTVITKEFWFGIHIGDGKCVCVYENGLYSQPIPWDDEGCVGNRSTSLCDTRTFEKFRYVYGKDVPVAVFVGSDGVDESFDDNGINKCYYSLASWIRNASEDEYRARADELLEKISRGGSGDDVSVSCIVSRTKELKKPFTTSKQVADKMEELYTTLRDAEQRYNELNSRNNELLSEIENIRMEIAQTENLLIKKRELLQDKIDENVHVVKNLSNMQNQIVPIIKQFSEAKEIKRKVDEYWTSLNVEIYDNEEVMNYVPSMEVIRTKEGEANNEEPGKTVELAEQAEAVETDEECGQTETQTSDVNSTEETVLHEEEKQIPVEEHQKTGFLGNIFRKK